MQHRGEIIKEAIYQSGYSITKLAERLGKSRRWVYLQFENSNVSLDLILQIGEIIHHDFSDNIKELKNSVTTFQEPPIVYGNSEDAEYWKNKYLKLLEEYTELLKDGTK
jgi:predicted transcriptional regulator